MVLALATQGKFQVGVLGSELSRSPARRAGPCVVFLSRPRAFIYNLYCFRDAHSGTDRRGCGGDLLAVLAFLHLPLSRGLAPRRRPFFLLSALFSLVNGLILVAPAIASVGKSSKVCISVLKNPSCHFAFRKSPVAISACLFPRHSNVFDSGLAGCPRHTSC